MRAALTDEQEMLLAAVRDTLQGEAPFEVVRAWLDDGSPAEFETLFAAGGWYGVGLPEADGGHGGDFADVALIAEQLGRAASPSGAWTATATVVPVLAGAPDLAEKLACGTAAAMCVDTSAVPGQPGAGSPRLSEGLVSGGIPRVLAADRAQVLLIRAEGASGEVMVAVDTDAPGVSVTPRPMMDRTRTIGDVHLDGAPARELDIDDVAAVWAALGERVVVLVAADALGASQRMLEMTVAYTLQREQFGGPIARFQAVKHAAATMLVEIEPVRSVVRDAARAIVADESDASLRVAVAATHAGEAAARIADRALMLHGAIGFTWEHDLQLLYKRAKLDAHLYGTGDEWRDRTADLLQLTGGTP